MTPVDRQLIYRTVGFLEYATALRMLDELVVKADAEEREALDELVGKRAEFRVYSGLHRRAAAAAAVDPRGTNYERKGLAWVAALARAELGGMLASLTPVAGPFDVLAADWDREAYGELLLDGALTHYAALASDPRARAVAMQAPDSELLAYIRRLSVARQMLHAALRIESDRLTPAQVESTAGYDRDLYALQQLYARHLYGYLQAKNRDSYESTTSVREKTVWQGCTYMIDGALRELKTGTATAESLPLPKR